MFCNQCGANLPNGAAFCAVCGAKVNGTPMQQAQPQQNLCPKCGAAINPRLQFCMKCGASLAVKTAQALMQAFEQESDASPTSGEMRLSMNGAGGLTSVVRSMKRL